MNQQKKKVLIVGAGPVGLCAAMLMAANRNLELKIVQKEHQPVSLFESRSLVINPRTVGILTGFNAQKQILNQAIKVSTISFYTLKGLIASGDMHEYMKARNAPYPYIYIYPQNHFNHLLAKEVQELGLKVRRGVELQKFRDTQEGVFAKFSGQKDEERFDLLLAADGAQSKVRKMLGIKFKGQTSDSRIYLADFENLGKEWREIRYVIGKTQFLMCIPVRDNLIRIVTNLKDYDDFFRKGIPREIGERVWKSDFELKNRVAETMNIGNVYLAGDAAHINGPFGGRGLNLGIEDAYVFAKLIKENRLSEYNQIRLPVVSHVVNQVRKRSIIMEKDYTFKKSLIPHLLKFGFYFMKDRMLEFPTGFDHEIAFLPQNM